MSNLGDQVKQSWQSESVDILRYTQWFLHLIDRDCSSTYRDKSWDLLRALFLQHKADWIDGGVALPISTLDLWRSTLEERGETTSGAVSDKARKRVNEHWPNLMSQFSGFEGRFTEAARKAGFSGLLWPSKHQSNGGNSSTYFLEWRAFDENVLQPELPAGYGELPFILRYHEDQSSLRFSWIGRLFLAPLMFKQQSISTMRIEGARRWIPAIGMGLLATVIGTMAVLALIPGASELNWNLLILAGAFYWIYLRPLARLYDLKIMMASPLFYPFKDRDCQIELQWDGPTPNQDRPRAYNLRLVRYAANCPLCGGRVWLEDGKLQYFNRVVGRCEEEPAEHVFSFDRKLRAGAWLRHSYHSPSVGKA
ncbi:hypothetical protein [Quatrionicoccus australiensis]|uniref:hypothetical protein n=1 Tax=Quatrionicoccus australiensis TaxID=138118 RepID=UPI001CF8B41D|nr:hypothetical protein [Quatrionicoccus australiensis]UCV13331.1 hypothetical protein KI612_10095 [Quatrionicoccus australiensis]